MKLGLFQGAHRRDRAAVVVGFEHYGYRRFRAEIRDAFHQRFHYIVHRVVVVVVEYDGVGGQAAAQRFLELIDVDVGGSGHKSALSVVWLYRAIPLSGVAQSGGSLF